MFFSRFPSYNDGQTLPFHSLNSCATMGFADRQQRMQFQIGLPKANLNHMQMRLLFSVII